MALTTQRSIVVGLDFGVHSSGFAYGIRSTDVTAAVILRLCHSWPDQPDGKCNAKTRTALLMRDGKSTAWGWSAVQQAALASDAQSRLVQRFKLALAGDAAFNRCGLPAGSNAVQVVADYLTFMRRCEIS